jgi:hypothetical protein
MGAMLTRSAAEAEHTHASVGHGAQPIMCSPPPKSLVSTTDVNTNSSRTKPKRRGRWWYLLWSVIGSVVLGVMVFFATVIFGLVAGTEFSPVSFKNRVFFYYQIPAIGIQVSPVAREEMQSAFSRYLVNNDFLPSADKLEERWDIARMNSGGGGQWKGDAAILSDYLEHDTRDSSPWWTWTEEHPELGRILWPKVGRLARDRHYLLIPNAMNAATLADDPEVLAKTLSDELAQAFTMIGKSEQARGNHEKAVELFDRALEEVPDYPPATEARAESVD